MADFDGDDMISSADLKEVINRLTGQDHLLSEEQMQQLIDNVRLGFFASVVSFVSSFFYIQLLLCSDVCLLWTLPNPSPGWARVIPILGGGGGVHGKEKRDSGVAASVCSF